LSSAFQRDPLHNLISQKIVLLPALDHVLLVSQSHTKANTDSQKSPLTMEGKTCCISMVIPLVRLYFMR
jgi:hypothetical protein